MSLWLCLLQRCSFSLYKTLIDGLWIIVITCASIYLWIVLLTRMYISRRKCEMVLAVEKKHHPVARVMYMIEYVVARALLGGC